MNNISKAIQQSRTLIWNGFYNSLRILQYATTYQRPLQLTSIINKAQTKHLIASPTNHIQSSLKPKKISDVLITRNIHSNRRQQFPRTPDLIYFPDVLRWMKTKIKFKYLRRVWDPTFSEGAFIYGSTQAVCRITEIINSNRVVEFEGLLTSPARIKLIEDMTKKMTRTQREIIRIYPRDIKILVPMSVELKKNGLEKECKIVMRVLALKWFPQRSGYLRLVLVALQSEFSKDYTHGINQDWNISGFDVMECTVLTETPSNTI